MVRVQGAKDLNIEQMFQARFWLDKIIKEIKARASERKYTEERFRKVYLDMHGIRPKERLMPEFLATYQRLFFRSDEIYKKNIRAQNPRGIDSNDIHSIFKVLLAIKAIKYEPSDISNPNRWIGCLIEAYREISQCSEPQFTKLSESAASEFEKFKRKHPEAYASGKTLNQSKIAQAKTREIIPPSLTARRIVGVWHLLGIYPSGHMCDYSILRIWNPYRHQKSDNSYCQFEWYRTQKPEKNTIEDRKNFVYYYPDWACDESGDATILLHGDIHVDGENLYFYFDDENQMGMRVEKFSENTVKRKFEGEFGGRDFIMDRFEAYEIKEAAQLNRKNLWRRLEGTDVGYKIYDDLEERMKLE